MKSILFPSFLIISLAFAAIVHAGDLDDGISKYTDDSVAKWEEIGKADKNIKFIIVNAKSKATLGKNKNKVNSLSGDANMNSVVLGAGANIKGDIIIIDESKGTKNNIAD